MSSFKILNKENWNRKEHFDFFSKMDYPFFSITTDVDISHCYLNAKNKKISFFLSYLHASLLAVHEIENFRYRIENEEIRIYDKINAAATIFREDKTFGFSFIPYKTDLNEFVSCAQREIERVQNKSGLCFDNNATRPDAIHYSTFPWTKFTSLTHAHNNNSDDSCPKITFGKTFQLNGAMLMTISIHVHHALMDGYHVSNYLNCFQGLLNEEK